MEIHCFFWSRWVYKLIIIYIDIIPTEAKINNNVSIFHPVLSISTRNYRLFRSELTRSIIISAIIFIAINIVAVIVNALFNIHLSRGQPGFGNTGKLIGKSSNAGIIKAEITDGVHL